MSITEIPAAAKPRRRTARPEQINLNVERVEHLTIEIKNAQDLRLLVDGFESRLAAVEDALPPTGLRPNGGPNGGNGGGAHGNGRINP